MESHPLDDEDVLIAVTVEHIPTRRAVTRTFHTAADDDETVTEVIRKAGAWAMDDLLALIETQGG